MSLIFEQFPGNIWGNVSQKTRISEYFIHYLSLLPRHEEPLAVIFESNHIDKDFLIDYSFFYSRCFEDVGKKVIRAHFFYGSVDEVQGGVYRILNEGLSKASSEHTILQKNYIGFTTIRPINSKVIGRTAFIKYPNEDGNHNHRHYPVYVAVRAHLAGIPFELETLPYQEQDTAVAACATTAIWCALPAIRKKFDLGTYYSPYEITNLAFESCGGYENRRFPNRGLTLPHILNVIQKMGFDPILIDAKTIPNTKFLDEVIVSHIEFGLPILACLELKKGSNSDGHLVTIVGYKFKSNSSELQELYIHDDQIGFYSKVTFTDSTHRLWDNEWISKYGYSSVCVAALVIPSYHKIRISYASMYCFMKSMGLDDNCFSISLTEISTIKQKIMSLGLNTFEDSQKALIFLTSSSPKYVWCVNVKSTESKALIIYDATSYHLHAVCTLTNPIIN